MRYVLKQADPPLRGSGITANEAINLTCYRCCFNNKRIQGCTNELRRLDLGRCGLLGYYIKYSNLNINTKVI